MLWLLRNLWDNVKMTVTRIFQMYSEMYLSYEHRCHSFLKSITCLTHWDWVTHLCFNKLIIIDSDNGLSPGWRQAIIWTNDKILLIRPLGTNFHDILIEIDTFSFKKIPLKMSRKWHPFCVSLNVLIFHWLFNPESVWMKLLQNTPSESAVIRSCWHSL